MEDYGYVKIKLNTLIKERDISKNKLCHLAQMERSQINRYCNGTVTRLDTAVLCRLCHVLNCSLSDLIEYVPNNDDQC